MNILIANRQRTKKIDARRLKEMTAAVLGELGIRHCELEINLVGASGMAALNETFLQHEGSTDVITFDYSEGKQRRNDVGIAGEIFISVNDAIGQAKEFRTRWQSEVMRYIIHGILHLLGHDDLRPDLRRKMKREENRLLRDVEKKFSLAQIERRLKISP
jgi:probable rRNA maturation factor